MAIGRLGLLYLTAVRNDLWQQECCQVLVDIGLLGTGLDYLIHHRAAGQAPSQVVRGYPSDTASSWHQGRHGREAGYEPGEDDLQLDGGQRSAEAVARAAAEREVGVAERGSRTGQGRRIHTQATKKPADEAPTTSCRSEVLSDAGRT